MKKITTISWFNKQVGLFLFSLLICNVACAITVDPGNYTQYAQTIDNGINNVTGKVIVPTAGVLNDPSFDQQLDFYTTINGSAGADTYSVGFYIEQSHVFSKTDSGDSVDLVCSASTGGTTYLYPVNQTIYPGDVIHYKIHYNPTQHIFSAALTDSTHPFNTTTGAVKCLNHFSFGKKIGLQIGPPFKFKFLLKIPDTSSPIDCGVWPSNEKGISENAKITDLTNNVIPWNPTFTVLTTSATCSDPPYHHFGFINNTIIKAAELGL